MLHHPGGRFREVYGWDSYSTMLGLEVDGRNDIAVNMPKGFAYGIDRYGHIPNGNRSYYPSRSQRVLLALGALHPELRAAAAVATPNPQAVAAALQ